MAARRKPRPKRPHHFETQQLWAALRAEEQEPRKARQAARLLIADASELTPELESALQSYGPDVLLTLGYAVLASLDPTDRSAETKVKRTQLMRGLLVLERERSEFEEDALVRHAFLTLRGLETSWENEFGD